MDDIQQLCDRVLIIREGALIADEKVTGLISSRAPFKWLVITMPTYADAKEIAEVVRSLEGFGKVEHLEPTIFKIRVPLNLVKEACQTALSLHPTLDFTVQEPDLEEVMGQIFTEGGGVA